MDKAQKQALKEIKRYLKEFLYNGTQNYSRMTFYTEIMRGLEIIET